MSEICQHFCYFIQCDKASLGMDNIGPKTEEFLTQFGLAFAKSFPAAIFLRLKAEFEEEKAESDDSRDLQYRDWDSITPSNLHSGLCYLRSGPNEGGFGRWSQVHLVELPDGNLGVFGDAKAAADGDLAKAKEVIRTAGYQLVRNVTEHYLGEVRSICAELDCDQPRSVIRDTPGRWLTRSESTECSSCTSRPGMPASASSSKVQPLDTGSDSEPLATMFRNVTSSSRCLARTRDLEKDELAIAFDLTVKKMSNQLTDLANFSDDGTEGQILAHMAFIAMLRLPFGRLAAWLNARGGAASTIEKLVDTAWKKMQDEAKEKSESLVTTVKPMVQAILEKKAELHDLIRSKVGEKIGEKLSELLQPILTLVTDPLVQELKKGVSAAIAVFEKDAKALLPGSSITGPTAKRNCGDALDGLKPDECSTNWRQSLLELLDAMVFTAEEEAGKAESPIESKALVGDVLEKAKLDGVALQKSFASGLFVELLLGKLKNKTKDFTDPILETAQSNIPESMSDIIDLQAEYEALLEVSIGAAIEKSEQ
uniref:ANK_REP_REGION domain-containing protein n=1 Tax=Macrostomum lignano TaxID=282301 RepID=A0A1I8HFQ5_9PLAT